MDTKNFELKTKVSLASRILVMEGQWDLDLGHVSARTPDGRGFYIKAIGTGLEEVTPEKILTIDFNGRKIEGE